MEIEESEPIVMRYNPQQNTFIFGNVILSSQFDSGNLGNAVQIDNLHVSCLIDVV